MKLFGAVLVAAFALVSVPACAPEDDADWYGDSRFTQEERDAIEAGVRWLAYQSGTKPITIAWTYEVSGSQPLPHTIRRELFPKKGGNEDGTNACVSGSVVYLGPEVMGSCPDCMPGLAAHEFAHCLLGFRDRYYGADPKAWSCGIMRVLYPMRWTSSEREQCRANPDRCHDEAWTLSDKEADPEVDCK